MRRRLAIVSVLATIASSVFAIPPVDAAPSVTASPDTDLVDGDVVTVRGEGYPADHLAGMIQCRTPAPRDITEIVADCSFDEIREGQTNARGAVQKQMPVQRTMTIGQETIDCASTPCFMVVTTQEMPGSFDMFTGTAGAALDFDETVPIPPPFEVTAEVIEVDARAATVQIACTQRARTLLVLATLTQERNRGVAHAGGLVEGRCTGTDTIVVPLLPHPEFGRNGVRMRPFRRLLRGPASLELVVYARRVDAEDSFRLRRPVRLTTADLAERRSIDNSDDLDVAIQGLRVTRNGRAVVRGTLACDGVPGGFVSVEILSPTTGGAFRRAGASDGVTCDGGTAEFALDISHLALPNIDRKADIVAAGPAELYVTASRHGAATDVVEMRPIELTRQIRPDTIRVPHRPESRLRIGRATAEGVRGSLRCPHRGQITVFATVAQQHGPIVRSDIGRGVVACSPGRTVVFDIEWQRRVDADHHSRIGLYAVAGRVDHWDGPWDHTQGGWRRT